MKRSRRLVLAATLSLVTAVATLTACGGGTDAAAGPITLRYSWWGNADRAKLVEKAIDRYEQTHPGITVQGTYADYDAYWQKLSTEAAGGGAADVLQMDFSFLREYSDRGVMLDLTPYVGKQLDLSDVVKGLEAAGEVNGTRFAVPVSGNTYAVIYDKGAFAAAGVPDPAAGWTWEQFTSAITAVAKQGKLAGTGNYKDQMYALEAQLREQGRSFYTEDGALGFTAEDLTRFWSEIIPLRDAKVSVAQEMDTQVYPVTPIAAGLTATEFSWDNLLLTVRQKSKADLALAPLPSASGAKPPHYLKPSQLIGGYARTKHPDQVAEFISFMTNDPEVGNIMGANRGLPPTNAQRRTAQLGEVDKIIEKFETTLGDKITKTPPPPPAGAGGLEQRFRRFAEEVEYNRTAPAKAAEEFFGEATSVLGR